MLNELNTSPPLRRYAVIFVAVTICSSLLGASFLALVAVLILFALFMGFLSALTFVIALCLLVLPHTMMPPSATIIYAPLRWEMVSRSEAVAVVPFPRDFPPPWVLSFDQATAAERDGNDPLDWLYNGDRPLLKMVVELNAAVESFEYRTHTNGMNRSSQSMATLWLSLKSSVGNLRSNRGSITISDVLEPAVTGRDPDTGSSSVLPRVQCTLAPYFMGNNQDPFFSRSQELSNDDPLHSHPCRVGGNTTLSGVSSEAVLCLHITLVGRAEDQKRQSPPRATDALLIEQSRHDPHTQDPSESRILLYFGEYSQIPHQARAGNQSEMDALTSTPYSHLGRARTLILSVLSGLWHSLGEGFLRVIFPRIPNVTLFCDTNNRVPCTMAKKTDSGRLKARGKNMFDEIISSVVRSVIPPMFPRAQEVWTALLTQNGEDHTATSSSNMIRNTILFRFLHCICGLALCFVVACVIVLCLVGVVEAATCIVIALSIGAACTLGSIVIQPKVKTK